MKFSKFKQDKGVAGLTILLSMVTILFVIGLLVMIFTLMGASLKTSIYDTTTATITNETLTTVAETGEDFATVDFRDVVCTIGIVTNASTGETIPATNYTGTGCSLAWSGASADDPNYNNTDWNVSYSYVWEADTEATDVMNATTQSVAEVTDWFGIFIVISAMVVLILLTVIIITAIRSSGMVAQ